MATLKYLPDPGAWPVTPRDTLNNSASKAADQQLSIAAENSVLRILYGTVTLGPQIASVLSYQGSLVILAVWGHGEVDSIVSMKIDDKPLAGVTAEHYKGTLGQGVDPTLFAAFDAQSIPYSDTLPGVCYSVIKVPTGGSSGFPRITATIKGRKVYDPRHNLLTYSESLWNTTYWGVGTTLANFYTVTQSTAITDIYTGSSASAKFVAAASSAPLFLRKSFSIPAGTYTSSIYMYVPAQAGVTVWAISCDFGDTEASGTITSTTFNTWVRVSIPTVSTVAVRGYLDFNITFNGAIPAVGAYFYATGAQLVPTALVGAYAKTTTTAITPVTAWSNNPALCLADFITHPDYGMLKTVDWDSVGAVAEECDSLVGVSPTQEKKRQLDLVMDNIQPTQDWLDTLRTYAGCWVITTDKGLKLVSDKAGYPLPFLYTTQDYFLTDYLVENYGTFDHASSNILSISSLKKRGGQSVPTVMIVTYRDTTGEVHKDNTVTIYADGVLAGTVPRRESSISLPGITRYSQAYREAVERRKKLSLNDLSFDLGVFDEAITVEVGDIVSVTHPLMGGVPKLMRVMGVSGEYGRYLLNLTEYSASVYSSDINSTDATPDTSLPSPTTPPAITSIIMLEELFQLQNGTWSSRWRVTWAAEDYPFLSHYRTELYIDKEGNGVFSLIASGTPSGELWVTPSVEGGKIYRVNVSAISSISKAGAELTATATAAGKTAKPGNVPNISAFEAGGRVYISWGEAIDIDVWKYEVRYSTVPEDWVASTPISDSVWNAATVIDKVDALRVTTDQIPVGTWCLHVKCEDSVGGQSPSAISTSVAVTSDSNSFLVSEYQQTAPTLTNMKEFTLARNDPNRYFISDDNDTWDSTFSLPFLNAANYPNTIATYHNSMTSTWLGELEDYGQLLGGQWTGTATVADISGTHISYFGHSPDASIWTYTPGLSQKLNARGVRLKHEALTTSTMLVTIPTQSVRLDAVPREEVGTLTTNASGVGTVVLVNEYTATKSVQLTPQGINAYSAVLDNIRINGYAISPMGVVPAGSEVLQFDCEVPALNVANAYLYYDFSNNNPAAYVTQAGDYLEYDSLLVTAPAGAPGVTVYNGTWGSGTLLFAQAIPSTVIGVWASQKVPVAATGLAVTHCAVTFEDNTPGKSSILIRNIRITNGSGTTRKILWQSGKPTLSVWLQSITTNFGCNYANSFDIYTFTSAGAPAASVPVQYLFKGV